ncbi:galactose-3-O-sulfotransferase 2-like [Glandiceps talaboti]
MKTLSNLRGKLAYQRGSLIHQRTNTIISPLKLPCEPQRNFVFIKTDKTGGSTLATVLFRYGLKHDLVAALDDRLTVHMRMNGTSNSVMIHPYNCTNFPGYNFIANHLGYNRKALDKIIKDGKYFTILRSPITRAESAFYYYRYDDGYRQFSNPFSAYLQTFVSQNDTSITTRKLNDTHIFNATERIRKPNYSHMFNGNFNRLVGRPKLMNDTFIHNSIRKLDIEFDLIMLTEYYDESLVLLRKMMCWEYEDMVYRSHKIHGGMRMPITPDLERIIKKQSNLDWPLYEYFNKTFWEKVKRYEGDFEEDLAKLRSVQNEVDDQCLKPQQPRSDYCEMLGKDTGSTLQVVIKNQRKWDC